MCPDNDKNSEDKETEHRGSAGPTPDSAESSSIDPTIPFEKGGAEGPSDDPDEVQTLADAEESSPTIAVPASHPTQATATGNVGGQSPTGGSVPFTPVRDMTTGSLEKAKANPGGKTPRSVGHRFANRFEVVDVLGEGGMGKVFRVKDTHIDNREMALKVLRPKYSNNPQFRALFTKEIHAAQNFVSENVVQIRDTGQTEDNQLFLTMDMVDGEDLHELLKREGALLPRHALEIIRQTLIGLHSGHEQGFIHRDIKPSNVMLSAHVPKTDQNPYGVGVHLLDFGIAGIAAEVSGQIAGTPMYMSPEQAQGQRLDPRSDLFTIGVMMFEMLSGTRPFAGKTLEQVVASILETNLTEKIAELKHLGRPVQKILTKALQKDREKRYQSASAFIEAIEKSKAFRAPKNMPAGALAVMTIAIVAAVGQAAYIFTSQDSAVQIRQDRDRLQAQLNAKNTELNTQKGQLEREHAQALAAKEAQFNKINNQTKQDLTQANQSLAAANILAEDLQGKVDTLQDEVNNRGDRIVELTNDRELKSTVIGGLKDELARLQREQELQAQKLAQLQRDTRIESVTAAGFDRMLVFLANHNSESARLQLNNLQSEGIFTRTATDGGQALKMFVEVSELLNQFDESVRAGAAEPQLLTTAENRLVLAGAQMESFETAASEWIGETLGEATPPDRLANLQNLLVLLETRLETLSSDLGDSTRTELEEILAGSPTQNPARAFQVASLAGADFLPRVLERCVNDLTSTYESDGELDLARLKSLDCLGPWVEYLESSGNAAKFNPVHVTTVNEFYAAQHWYTGDDQARESIEFAMPIPTTNASSPSTDWRASLAIQMSLHRKQALPQPRGTVAVYLLTNTATGAKSWIIEQSDPPVTSDSSGERSYTTRLRSYSVRGQSVIASAPRERKSSWKNWKFQEARTVILDLLTKPDVARVQSWQNVAVNWDSIDPSELPRVGDFPSAADRDEFRGTIAETSPLCLVVKDGKNTRWFSPSHGLIHFDNGTIHRDLVYLGR